MFSVKDLINKIPQGYTEGWYNNYRYGITKQIFNKGKSVKIYAKQLAGTDFISLNYYHTTNAQLLKPCEMTEAKVIDFLQHVILEDEK